MPGRSWLSFAITDIAIRCDQILGHTASDLEPAVASVEVEVKLGYRSTTTFLFAFRGLWVVLGGMGWEHELA
jgi:hypothetical protein